MPHDGLHWKNQNEGIIGPQEGKTRKLHLRGSLPAKGSVAGGAAVRRKPIQFGMRIGYAPLDDGRRLVALSVGGSHPGAVLRVDVPRHGPATVDHGDESGHSLIRLGLCCAFRNQPIKFANTTATAIGNMTRPDALAKLSRLCLENADASLAALQFCADNGIGCFRVNSQILPLKTHPTSG